jgi:hypothetical protein
MAEMTSKQRLLTAIKHQEADRVPVSPRMHLWALEQYGDHNWMRQLQIQEELGTDPFFEVHFPMSAYIRAPFSGDYRDLPGVAVEIEVQNKGDINQVHRVIHTPAGELRDVVDLPHRRSQYGLSPSPVTHEPLVKGADDVDKIAFLFPDPRTVTGTNWPQILQIIGERGLLYAAPRPGLGAPVMATAMGMENTMLAFYSQRELFDRLLTVFADHHLAITEVMLELGAPVIYNSWHDFGVSGGWSPKIFRAAFKPIIQATAELIHSYDALYLYFDNGAIRPLLPDLAEVGVDIVHSLCPPPVGDVDLAEAKEMIGDRVCLYGNVDAIWVVQKGTPAQVREAVREAMQVGAPGGGFILGNSDCFFMDTPKENILAFFEAAHEFNRYPIGL